MLSYFSLSLLITLLTSQFKRVNCNESSINTIEESKNQKSPPFDFLPAAKDGNLVYLKEKLELFISQGGDLQTLRELTNHEGDTALILAATEGHYFTSLLLIESKVVDVNAANGMGYTALHCASAKNHSILAAHLIPLTAARRVNLGTVSQGMTPLLYACRNRNLDLIRQLLVEVRGTSLGQTNLRGDSCLHLALSTQDVGFIEALLDLGAELNGRGARRRTVLMEAIRRELPDIVKLLVSRGADLRSRDEMQQDAFSYAVATGNESLTAIIRNAIRMA